MSDIEKHLRWLRDVSGRTNLEAAAAIEALQAEVATLNVMVTDWIEAFDKQKARAEAAEAEVERLKGVLGIFAAIKADDGDTFDTWNDDVIIRCEVTVGDLKKARAALEVSR